MTCEKKSTKKSPQKGEALNPIFYRKIGDPLIKGPLFWALVNIGMN
jgi:hypothetical protein